MLPIGLIVGGVAGYLVCLKQDAIKARVDEKVGKWFKR